MSAFAGGRLREDLPELEEGGTKTGAASVSVSEIGPDSALGLGSTILDREVLAGARIFEDLAVLGSTNLDFEDLGAS